MEFYVFAKRPIFGNFFTSLLEYSEFSDTFKEGQDFEYVKYKLSQVLGVNPEQIFLYHNDKAIIPVYSICDIEYKPEETITVKIKSE